MSKSVFLLIFTALSLCASAQKPYFQQEVNYEINVRLDDEAHFLHAFESFTYTNNSPDTLHEMYLHLWPNAYKNRKSAFSKQKLRGGSTKFWDAPDSDRGFIDSLAIKIDGKAVAWKEWEENPDIALIQLDSPILPGQSVKFSTPFRVKIPKSWSRLGHIGQQYQITQWYPKPAVYDRDGWHPIPYLDQGEFYSEFGSFKVTIDIPKNYVVGATGDLQNNPEEEAWLVAREALSREKLEQDTLKLFDLEFPKTERKKLTFYQEKVHDFAWFCDKQYYVLSDSVELPQSKRKVKTVAMFTATDRKIWENAPKYLNQSVYYYSLWNGDYPYNHATAVDGALSAGAGMEYPNITVVGANGSASALEQVIMHEVGHNWFYGILASNERKHPWLDEGLNTYMEGRYWNLLHDGKTDMLPDGVQKAIGLELTHSSMARVALDFQQGTGSDQPIEFPAEDYSQINYGVIVYMKTGLAFEMLEEHLGEEMILKCFHAYFDEWKFKHPDPKAIQEVFERVSGEDLDWFFVDYLNGIHKTDMKVVKAKDGKVEVVNKSGTALPVTLAFVDKERNELGRVKVPAFEGRTTVDAPVADYFAVIANPDERLPEFREENNFYKTRGLFRRGRQFQLKFGYKYPDPEKIIVNFLPVVNFNSYDKFAVGLLFYHQFFPKQKFEFHVLPTYAFGSEKLAGSAGFTYRWLPSGAFKSIEFRGFAANWSGLNRIRPSLKFNLRPKSEQSPFRHSFALTAHIAEYTDSVSQQIDLPGGFSPVFTSLNWEGNCNKTVQQFRGTAEVGYSPSTGIVRLSASGAISRRFLKKQWVKLRAFAGVMPVRETDYPALWFGLSGSADPFGQQPFLDRNQLWGKFPQQITSDHGGFHFINSIRYNNAAWALNFETTLGLRGLRAFFDLGGGTSVGTGIGGGFGGPYMVSGISFQVLDGGLRFNFPLLDNLNYFPPANRSGFFSKINFTFEPLKIQGLLTRGLN